MRISFLKVRVHHLNFPRAKVSATARLIVIHRLCPDASERYFVIDLSSIDTFAGVVCEVDKLHPPWKEMPKTKLPHGLHDTREDARQAAHLRQVTCQKADNSQSRSILFRSKVLTLWEFSQKLWGFSWPSGFRDLHFVKGLQSMWSESQVSE
jgi:hypothetical protein